MRQLSIEELVALATKVIEEHGNLAEWQATKSFAEQYYGPQAAKVAIFVESEYNDEGGYSNYIDHVEVYDAEGNSLKPSIAGTYWQNELKNWRKNYPAGTRSDQEIFDQDMALESESELKDLDAFDELPRRDVTIQLKEPPTLTVPPVYVDA